MLTGKLGTLDSMLGNFQLGRVPSGGLTQTINDTLVFAEIWIGQKYEFIDSITFTDAMTEVKWAAGPFSDTLTFSDYFIFPLEDTLSFSDEMDGLVWRTGAGTDTLTLSDTHSVNIIALRTNFETLTLVEHMSQNMIRLVTTNDTLTLTDTFAGLRNHPFVDTMTFSETMTEFISKTFHDEVDFDDTLKLNGIFNRNIADQLVLFDSIPYNATLHPVMTDTIGFGDGMVGDSVKPLIPESITIVDAISCTVSTPILETLTFADSYKTNLFIGNRNLGNDVITFNENMVGNHISNVVLADSLTLLDTEVGVHWVFGTANDSLTLTDEAYRELIGVLITDTVVYTDSETNNTIFAKSLSDSLVLTDEMHENVVFEQTISDALTLNDGFLVKITQGTPHPAPPDSTNPLPGGGTEGVITVFPQTVIVGLKNSIILPAPEFNDYEAQQGKIAVTRSMTGNFRVYSKRTDREKANWRFVLPKFKADELEAFINAEINNQLDITDFKGNKWQAKILSDSVDFTETGRWDPCGNKVEVTIEIEGIKYA